MNETIIGALQEYLDQCPLLEGRRLNVDYLTRRPLTYMISPSPVDLSLIHIWYSVTYRGSTENSSLQDAADAARLHICRKYLCRPVNLLYTGVQP